MDAVVPSRSTRSAKTPAIAILILLLPIAARAHFVGAHEAQVWGSPIERESFGTAVAIDASGTRAFFGAPTYASGDGRVLVFVRSGRSWTTEADVGIAATGTSFGASVDASADGARMIVGAPSDGSGSARVFVRSGSTWTEEAVLVATTFVTGGFGTSVAMSPDAAWAVVGSPSAGVAEVFSRAGMTWSSAGVVTSTSGASEAFGTSVAIDATGTRVCVGAPLATVAATSSAGSAFVFRADTGGWVEERRIDNPSPVSSGQFGKSVALDDTGTRALIGGYFSRAYVFARAGTSWTEEAQLLGILLAGYQGAYVSLDASATHAVVGLPAQDRSGRAHAFVRTGTTWSADGDTQGLGGVIPEGFGSAIAVSADATRLVVGAPASPISGVGYVFASVGDPCADGSTCPTGLCVGGVCCDSACTDECVSCAAAETGAAFDGSCDTYSSAVARTVVCRAASGVCDAEETCASWSRTCPSDEYERATVCRSIRGACDRYEYCDGTGPDCPADARAPAGTTCRSAAGACDVAEVCDGVSDDCPANVRAPAGTTCRASAGVCDVAEVCDGVSAACPANATAPAGTPCRASTDPSCDPAEACTGASASCPTDVIACGMDAGLVDAGAMGAGDAGAMGAGDAGAPDGGADAGASADDAGPPEADAGLDAAIAAPDGGADAGSDAAPPASDAAIELDAGADAATDGGASTEAGGCTCRAGARSRSPRILAALLGVALVVLRRARRRSES